MQTRCLEKTVLKTQKRCIFCLPHKNRRALNPVFLGPISFRSTSEQSAQSNLARDRTSLIPCVAGRGDGNHQRQTLQRLEVFKAPIAWKWPCERCGPFPMHCCGWRLESNNARSQQNPSFVDMCSAAPCVCNADPCACATPILMPVEFQSLCHGLHALGPPHPFFHLPYQHNRVQKDTRHGFRNLPVLKEWCLRGLQ